MGPSPSSSPEIRVPPDAFAPVEPLHALPPSVRPSPPRDPAGRYIVLFVLTLITTTWVGASHYIGFRIELGATSFNISTVSAILHGFWYSLSILAILGSHEFGHYFACRYYRVDASLPYFLPVPPFVQTGTLGAVIRIRQPIERKRELFDIGIAGPIAGFVVLVPLLFIGLAMSNVIRVPPRFVGLELGEPILFKAATWLIKGSIPAGYSVNMHPMAFAAWFGMMATALNLLPIGQLDGGHISYAVLGRKSSLVTLAGVVVLIALTLLVSTSWLIWTVLIGIMLLTFGPHHPRTIDEYEPLDPMRQRLAIFAFVMFVLCFTPAPILPVG
jgi:membrane-associated protease RseP (regulator of RpoE activity)